MAAQPLRIAVEVAVAVVVWQYSTVRQLACIRCRLEKAGMAHLDS
jgi:hypothetical protein